MLLVLLLVLAHSWAAAPTSAQADAPPPPPPPPPLVRGFAAAPPPPPPPVGPATERAVVLRPVLPAPLPGAVVVPVAPCEPCATPCWVRRAGASVSLQQGNTENFNLKLDGEVERKPDPWGFRASLAFVYGETDGETSAENWHGLVRTDRKLGDRNYVFAQVLFDRDAPASLEHRFTFVAGAGRELVKTAVDLLKGEVGLGGVLEKRTDIDSAFDPTAYASLRYERCWGDGKRFFADVKVLPNLSDFDLTRTTFEAGYECPICPWLKGTVGARLDWVVDPPGGDVEPVDLLLTAGLRAEF
jgi:uncharacterized protein DUF481